MTDLETRRAAYKLGTKIVFKFNNTRIVGEVVENTKLPGDICVQWNDLEFLEENTHPYEPTGKNIVPNQ